jgi:hypothetical protein
MAADPQRTLEETEVTFARDLGLFDATMIGIGAMIGAGIFVLTGIAAGEAGPAALVAFALNSVVTLLTALSYAELASVYPKSGGGYSFIIKAFPGPAGFASGWMLWFCYIIACALCALGFGSYFWEFIQRYFPPIANLVFSLEGHKVPALAMTAPVSIVFVLVNMRGTAVTGSVENIITTAKIIILGVFIAYGLKRVFEIPSEAAASFTPFLPNGAGLRFDCLGRIQGRGFLKCSFWRDSRKSWAVFQDPGHDRPALRRFGQIVRKKDNGIAQVTEGNEGKYRLSLDEENHFSSLGYTRSFCSCPLCGSRMGIGSCK